MQEHLRNEVRLKAEQEMDHRSRGPWLRMNGINVNYLFNAMQFNTCLFEHMSRDSQCA